MPLLAVFLRPEIALLNSTPLAYIIEPTPANANLASRRERDRLMRIVSAPRDYWRPDPTSFTQAAGSLFDAANQFFSGGDDEDDNDEGSAVEARLAALDLARALLLQLADLDPTKISDLSTAILEGDDGYANALLARMNEQLAGNINFLKWWVAE